MKKLLYIICVLGLCVSLQSCDEFPWEKSDDVQQEQTADTQPQVNSNDNSVVAANDSAVNAKMQSQLKQNESGIKKLRDSLDIVNSELANQRLEVEKLQQQLNNLENDKVGVKNLFIYLAIFSIVAIVLIVLLTKKLVGKNSINERQVKGIVEDLARRHPEMFIGNMQALLNQHGNELRNNQYIIEKITANLNALTNYINGLAGGSNVASGQQSWEQQAATQSQQNANNESGGETSRVFYMKRPLKEMEFDLSLRKEKPTEDTMYRFEVNRKNPNKAQFVFDCDSPSRVRWALTTKDKTLDRVCNASGSGANGKYNCTAPGEAELREGKWVVTRKAVVLFD